MDGKYTSISQKSVYQAEVTIQYSCKVKNYTFSCKKDSAKIDVPGRIWQWYSTSSSRNISIVHFLEFEIQTQKVYYLHFRELNVDVYWLFAAFS